MKKRSGFLASVGLGTVSLLLAAGCSSAVGDGGASKDGPASAGGSSVAPPAGGGGSPVSSGGGAGSTETTAECDPKASLAPARVWRITDPEYVNVVEAVFGVTMPPEISEAAVNTGDYDNLSEGTSVSDAIALNYQKAAQQAAQQAVTSHLAKFLPCGQQAPTDACVQQFIRNRVSRAFGRPVSDEEVQGLLAVYKTSGVDGAAMGIKLVIQAALQSASFLYRSELGGSQGAPAGKVSLTPYEIASALSFSLLDSAPDDELWATAENGSISTPKVLSAQVDRLLALPEAQANLSHQASFWLGVEKVPLAAHDLGTFPAFTATLKNDLYESAQLFVKDLFGHGNVKDLLTSRRMYLNESMAKVYGIPGVTGTNLIPVDVQLPERSGGILTQPAVLTATDFHPKESDPIHRGLFIYRSLVCGSAIGSPPANANAVNDALPGMPTQRERSDFRTGPTSPGCGACHGMFDAFGLATEAYDPIGRYVPSVDSTATISERLGPALAGHVAGLSEVIDRLKQGRLVSDCAAANLGVMTLGVQIQRDNSCAVKTVKDTFATSGSFTDFYRALLTSPGFVTRDVPAAQ